jgi:hypothetical protein
VQLSRLEFRFVEFIPHTIEDGILLISLPFATAIHRCCCGCGREVVTPLARDGWTLSFDGESVSLHPSIGNWSFPCHSHYWIRRSQVEWARQWSRYEIEVNRSRECLDMPLQPERIGEPASDDKERGQGRRFPAFLWLTLRKFIGRI